MLEPGSASSLGQGSTVQTRGHGNAAVAVLGAKRAVTPEEGLEVLGFECAATAHPSVQRPSKKALETGVEFTIQ